jgi:hypothetical protein
MAIQPEGEDLRKAVKWVSDKRKYEDIEDLKKLADDACLKFNLSPKDAEFLSSFLAEN